MRNLKRIAVAAVTVTTVSGVVAGQAAAEPVVNTNSTDLMGPLNSMVDVFSKADDPTGLKGLTDLSDADTGDVKSLVGAASGLDVKQYSSTIESVLKDAGVDDETASVAARSSTGMTDALVNAADSEDLMNVLDGAPKCITAMAGLATSAAGMAAGTVGGAATGGVTTVAAAPAAASAATASIPGLLGCVKIAGSALTVAGKVVQAYENDQDAPQMVEFARMLNPDKGLGKEVVSQMPEDQQDAAAQAMTLTSEVAVPLSKVKFGDALVDYGTAVTGLGEGDPTASAAIVPATMKLGVQVASAVGEVAGADTSGLSDMVDLDTPKVKSSVTSSKSSDKAVDTDELDEVVSSSDSKSDSSSSTSSGSSVKKTTISSGSSSSSSDDDEDDGDVDEDASGSSDSDDDGDSDSSSAKG